MTIEIRNATVGDSAMLRRLAERDCARVPEGELLLAFEQGELRAVRSASGSVIADPFAPTAGLVATLEAAASTRARDTHRSAPRLTAARARLAG